MLYTQGGFVVDVALTKREVEAAKEHVHLLQVNPTAVRKHVSEVERKSRTEKE